MAPPRRGIRDLRLSFRRLPHPNVRPRVRPELLHDHQLIALRWTRREVVVVPFEPAFAERHEFGGDACESIALRDHPVGLLAEPRLELPPRILLDPAHLLGSSSKGVEAPVVHVLQNLSPDLVRKPRLLSPLSSVGIVVRFGALCDRRSRRRRRRGTFQPLPALLALHLLLQALPQPSVNRRFRGRLDEFGTLRIGNLFR